LATRGHRLYLDEDSLDLYPHLTEFGYDVLAADSEHMLVADDPRQMARALALGRTVVTDNRDELAFIQAVWIAAKWEHFRIISISSSRQRIDSPAFA
jgi:hypothetical protein